MTKTPWIDYDRFAGRAGIGAVWNTAEFPFIVRWTVSHASARWIDHIRYFRTREDAIAAYTRPFKGMSASVEMYNGGTPGRHLSTIVSRKPGQAHKWR